jgi:ankyrin repeat protein
MSNIFEWYDCASTRRSATMLELAVESAIASGSLDVVEIALRLGAPINRAVTDNDMPSALQLAVTQDVEMETPLSEAITVDLVKLLLDWGADVRIPMFHGAFDDDWYDDIKQARMTLIQSAAAQGRTSLVRLLVDAGADVNAPAGHGSFTAIQAAARSGDAEMVECLIQSGANVNAPTGSTYGWPALVAAVAKGDSKSVALLLQAKADPNTPAIVEIEPGVKIKMTSLQTASWQPESWFDAVDDDSELRLKMLKLLLDAGADPQQPHLRFVRDDRSALAWAVLSHDIDAVKLLLDYRAYADGAELWRTAEDYECPLEIYYLLGFTCCEDAIRLQDDFDESQLLLRGPDQLPYCLHSACLQGNLSLVNHLLDHGADINVVCSITEDTALTMAANRGYVAIAHRLIEAGADPANALEEAEDQGRLDICQLLRVADSDPRSR